MSLARTQKFQRSCCGARSSGRFWARIHLTIDLTGGELKADEM